MSCWRCVAAPTTRPMCCAQWRRCMRRGPPPGASTSCRACRSSQRRCGSAAWRRRWMRGRSTSRRMTCRCAGFAFALLSACCTNWAEAAGARCAGLQHRHCSRAAAAPASAPHPPTAAAASPGGGAHPLCAAVLAGGAAAALRRSRGRHVLPGQRGAGRRRWAGAACCPPQGLPCLVAAECHLSLQLPSRFEAPPTVS